MYLWVCYLDLNGPQDTCGGRRANAFCPSAPWARLAPGPLSFAREIRERLGLSPEEAHQLFREVAGREYRNLQLPLPVDEAWAILGREMLSSPVNPGYYQGQHYTAYVDQVKDLKRKGELSAAERLLLGLIEAVETEAKQNHWAVAPWYNKQLAIIYRKQKEGGKAGAILERYVAQSRALWVRSPTSD